MLVHSCQVTLECLPPIPTDSPGSSVATCLDNNSFLDHCLLNHCRQGECQAERKLDAWEHNGHWWLTLLDPVHLEAALLVLLDTWVLTGRLPVRPCPVDDHAAPVVTPITVEYLLPGDKPPASRLDDLL